MHITNENLDCCIVTFFLHNVCNYQCSYCSEYHNGGDQRWPEDWKPYLNFINEIKKRNKYVYIEVLGGEPTVWPQFQDFVEYLSDDDVFIEFATNASRTLRYWKEFRLHHGYVFLSWHHEQADDDHFYQVAEILQDKASVSIPLMMLPENFDRGKKLYDRLKKLKVEITPKFTRVSIHGFQYPNYTEEQTSWIKSSYYNKMMPFNIDWKIPIQLHLDGVPTKFTHILSKNLHYFENYTCTAGLKRLYVEANGDVKRCTKGVGGIVANIFEDYTLPTDPIVCDYKACPCKLDALVEKWK